MLIASGDQSRLPLHSSGAGEKPVEAVRAAAKTRHRRTPESREGRGERPSIAPLKVCSEPGA